MRAQPVDENRSDDQIIETDGNRAPEVTNRPNLPSEILGQVTWLMLQSPAHKHLFLTDLEWLAAPAISLKQFRIYRQENTPVAFVSWAFLNEEAEQRLLSGQRKLSPVEWKEGDRAWIIDIVAPFGGTDEILRSLKKTIFPDQDVRTLVPGEDGKSVRVLTISEKQEDASVEEQKAEDKPKKATAKKPRARKPSKTKKSNSEAAE